MSVALFDKIFVMGNKSKEFIKKIREMTNLRDPKELIRYNF